MLEREGAAAKQPQDATPRKVVEAALTSNLVNPRLSIEEAVKSLGPDIDEVAGYVLAWDKYVLVVASQFDAPVINFRR